MGRTPRLWLHGFAGEAELTESRGSLDELRAWAKNKAQALSRGTLEPVLDLGQEWESLRDALVTDAAPDTAELAITGRGSVELGAIRLFAKTRFLRPNLVALIDEQLQGMHRDHPRIDDLRSFYRKAAERQLHVLVVGAPDRTRVTSSLEALHFAALAAELERLERKLTEVDARILAGSLHNLKAGLSSMDEAERDMAYQDALDILVTSDGRVHPAMKEELGNLFANLATPRDAPHKKRLSAQLLAHVATRVEAGRDDALIAELQRWFLWLDADVFEVLEEISPGAAIGVVLTAVAAGVATPTWLELLPAPAHAPLQRALSGEREGVEEALAMALTYDER